MDLEVRHLRQFVAVAEERSFTRAAERLHTAQPALSARIRELEERLSVRLFERTTRRVDLTPAGEELLGRAQRLLADHAATVLAVRDVGGAPAELRVGLLGTAGAELIGPVIRRLGASRPDIEVIPVALETAGQVSRGEVDVAFSRLSAAETELTVDVLTREPRVLACAADNPLARKQAIRMADLGDEGFLTLAADDNPQWRARWLAEQHRHGLPGRIVAEVTDAAQVLALLAAGRGVCLVPEGAARAAARPGIAFVPVSDAEPAVLSLVWRPGAPGGLIAELTGHAREQLEIRTSSSTNAGA